MLCFHHGKPHPGKQSTAHHHTGKKPKLKKFVGMIELNSVNKTVIRKSHALGVGKAKQLPAVNRLQHNERTLDATKARDEMSCCTTTQPRCNNTTIRLLSHQVGALHVQCQRWHPANLSTHPLLRAGPHQLPLQCTVPPAKTWRKMKFTLYTRRRRFQNCQQCSTQDGLLACYSARMRRLLTTPDKIPACTARSENSSSHTKKNISVPLASLSHSPGWHPSHSASQPVVKIAGLLLQMLQFGLVVLQTSTTSSGWSYPSLQMLQFGLVMPQPSTQKVGPIKTAHLPCNEM